MAQDRPDNVVGERYKGRMLSSGLPQEEICGILEHSPKLHWLYCEHRTGHTGDHGLRTDSVTWPNGPPPLAPTD